MKVRHVGDTALLCEVADLSTVHRLRAGVLAAAYDGVIDVVPGWTTVLLVTDPERCELATLERALAGLALPLPTVPEAREHVLAATYDGPDLDEVARRTGLTPGEVVSRHAAVTYTVAFLGFQPGFPYLAGMDPALAVPRKDSPRTQVPAGSIGIADAVTGIYPASSPGGWQLIGRTDAPLFDLAREPPALLGPGDRVRFART